MEECQVKLTQDKQSKPEKKPKMLQFCATVFTIDKVSILYQYLRGEVKLRLFFRDIVILINVGS